MTLYRLRYPANIYATVAAENPDAAREKLAQTLQAVQEGIIIQLDIEQNTPAHEVLFPDTDQHGNVTHTLAQVVDEEDY